MNKIQDQCVKYVREWNRIDKARNCRSPSEEDKRILERDRDRAEAMLSVVKPESLEGAGCLIQHAARRAPGAIPHEVWQVLLSIGGHVRQSKFSLAEVIALRQTIAAMELMPVVFDDCKPLPGASMMRANHDSAPCGAVAFVDCCALVPDHKDNILLMLNHALDFVTRPRLV